MRVVKREAIFGKSTENIRRGEDEGPNNVLNPPKARKCQKCGDKTHNYFKCHNCYYFENYEGLQYDDMAEGFDA